MHTPGPSHRRHRRVGEEHAAAPKLSVRPSSTAGAAPERAPSAEADGRSSGSGSGVSCAGEASGTSGRPEKPLRGLAYSDSASWSGRAL